MLMADSHVHSIFSSDGEATLQSLVEAALHQGMSYFYLTDHYDIDYPVGEDGRDFILDMSGYLQALEKLQEQYSGKIQIRAGVELGLMAKAEEKIKDFYRQYSGQLDLVIGSSHLVNGLDPYYAAYYTGKTERQAYADYFQSILDNVRLFDQFDVYGHLDYVVRYGPNKDAHYRPMDYQEIFQELLKLLIVQGKGIEINTGSLYKGFTFAHPHQDILRLYRKLGGELITVGSDAHQPQYLGYGFQQVERLLRETGFRAYCLYQRHQPKFVDLPA